MPSSHPKLSSKPTDDSPKRDRWIATLTIATLVLVPVLAGRVLGPGWPHPFTPDEPAGVDKTQDSDAALVVETEPIDEPTPTDPKAPWRLETAGEVWSQPVLHDGTVFVGSDDGSGYAVDLAGRESWRTDLGSKVRSRAAVADGLAIWTSEDGAIVAADSADGDSGGTRRWRTKISSLRTDAALVAERVVVGTETGLTALERETGRAAWAADIGPVTARPAADGRRVVAGTADGQLVAVNAHNGRVAWRFDAGAEISTPPTVAGRFVLFTTGDGSVYCLEAATGRVRWRSGTSEFVGSAPAVADGRVFVGGGDGALWAFDLDSGLGLWRRKLAEAVRGTPFAHGDTLWMAAGERYLAAVRASDGEPLHVFAVDGWVSASPIVVAPEGGPERLVFPTSDGSLHGVPLRLVVDDLALRPAVEQATPREARLVIEPTFHDGRPVILWQSELPGRAVAAPTPASGRVLVAAGRHLVALHAESGKELWRATEPMERGTFGGSLVLADGQVLAPQRAGSTGRGALAAYDSGDGRRLWRTDVDDDVASRPAVWRDRAIFGTAGGRLIAASKNDGSVLWERPTDGAMNAGPAVADAGGFGIVIAGGCDGVVYGVSAEDGRELWRFRAGACVATDVTLAEASGQELAYVADSSGNVFALDPTVGGELWGASIGGGAGRRSEIEGGTLYLGTHDGELWSLSALFGSTRWRFEAGGALAGGVALDLGIAYAASNDGALHAVGAINGQEFWRLETPDPAYDVAFADGTVYVVTASADGGRLYALRVP